MRKVDNVYTLPHVVMSRLVDEARAGPSPPKTPGEGQPDLRRLCILVENLPPYASVRLDKLEFGLRETLSKLAI